MVTVGRLTGRRVIRLVIVIEGRPLIDVHLHAVRRNTVKPPWQQWLPSFSSDRVERLYRPDGTLDPALFDDFLAGEGVDIALLLAEYSPKVTGIQPVEDMLPLAAANPQRIRLIGNLNPHLHYPVAEELQRQLDLGVIALKVHPVHAGAAANDRALYPAYELCQSLGLPVVVHCGTSTFPGALNSYADPVLLDEPLRDFPRLQFVLAHGGRGWWYDAAAFLALSRDNVWIELSGLPPSRLRGVLRPAELGAAHPPDDLRHRLAGGAGHRAECPRGGRAVPRCRDRGPGVGGQRGGRLQPEAARLMPIYALGPLVPRIDPTAFVHPDATVIGDVRIGARSSIWPAAVLRGDAGYIEVGERTSIQDGTVLHTTEQWPTVIGSGCVVGHNTHWRVRVGDGCLIGSGSVVLNRAAEPGAGVAAAALVLQDTVVPAGQIAMGVPARLRPVGMPGRRGGTALRGTRRTLPERAATARMSRSSSDGAG